MERAESSAARISLSTCCLPRPQLMRIGAERTLARQFADDVAVDDPGRLRRMRQKTHEDIGSFQERIEFLSGEAFHIRNGFAPRLQPATLKLSEARVMSRRCRARRAPSRPPGQSRGRMVRERIPAPVALVVVEAAPSASAAEALAMQPGPARWCAARRRTHAAKIPLTKLMPRSASRRCADWRSSR